MEKIEGWEQCKGKGTHPDSRKNIYKDLKTGLLSLG